MNSFKYIRTKILDKTMDELADLLNVSKQSIYMWESGKKKIPEKRLEELSSLTGIPANYFQKELTELDKNVIERSYLDSPLVCDLSPYADSYREMLDTQRDELVTMDKIKKVISNITDNENPDEYNYQYKNNVELFDRFTNIVESGAFDKRTLFEILRGLELCFFDLAKKYEIWGESNSMKSSSIEDTRELTQKIHKVVSEHIAEEKQKNEDAIQWVKDNFSD